MRQRASSAGSARRQRSRGSTRTLQNAPQIATIAGVRQIVFHHTSGVAGISPKGELLWNWDGYRRGTLTASPSISPDGYIYVCSGHDGESALFQVTLKDSAWECRTVYAEVRGSTPHHVSFNKVVNSAAWWDGAFYTIGGKGMHCLLPDGSIPWTTGKGRDEPQFELPSLIIVNGIIVTLDGMNTRLLLAEANQKEFKQLATLPLHKPKGTKAQLVYADGRVLSRCSGDLEVVCVDLGTAPSK